MIISFGYRHGNPAIKYGDIVIDVRTHLTRNPYHNKKLRSLRGDDPLVIADLEKTPHLDSAYNFIKAKASWIKNGNVYIGCTGGHHRSVYIANRLGKDLGVEVKHRDYDKK